MRLDPAVCHAALDAHDPRFDGLFFVGVTSTGIYCRPICPARTPKRENRTFHPSAAAAEAAGFRPCLRCRPETAPGRSSVDAIAAWARAAVRRIEDGALTEQSVPELAEELGISDRHLRRVIQHEFGVSPVELAQTHRLLTAKRLLTDTRLPLGEVALASGFSSVRRFNALFSERYRLTPTHIRKKGKPEDTVTCELPYRPPLDWKWLIDFVGFRACCGVEARDGDSYLRTVSLKNHKGWIRVGHHPTKNALKVEMSEDLAHVLPEVLTRVKRIFDLHAEPQTIVEALGPLAAENPGLRIPGAFDGFELAVRAILGQQVSVQAACVIAGRFMQAFGEPIETAFPALNKIAPTPARIAQLEPETIAEQGIIKSRAKAIVALAQKVAAKEIVLRPGVDVDATIEKLCQVPGIGPWTAHYVAMRALGYPDAFPHGDVALKKALGASTEKDVLCAGENYRPWRAYAAIHLWHSLGVIQ